MLAKIYITLKRGVLDPQGKAVEHALDSLKFSGVKEVRIGKYIEVRLNSQQRQQAEAEVKQMCAKVLANPVIESYRFDLVEEA